MTTRRARAPRAPRGIVEELLSSHRFTALALLAMLALSMTSSAYLVLHTQPRLDTTISLTRLTRDGHEAMLNQETGLRGWLATGDAQFLEPYDDGLRDADANFAQLVAGAEDTPEITGDVVATLLARQRWQQWAVGAARLTSTARESDDGALERTLITGKQLFDDYRTAESASLFHVQDLRSRAQQAQRRALIGSFASYLALLLVAGGLFVRRRRQMDGRILTPVRDLLATIGALQQGDLSARCAPTQVPELEEIGTQLNRLAHDLDDERTRSVNREARLALMAERFETVVRVGREISGSLSVRYVSASVTAAAADLLGVPATLWTRADDRSFQVANRSSDVHGVVTGADLTAPDLVLQAAAEARMVCAAGGSAYPLVLAGMVTGVLEVAVAVADVDADTEQVLNALLSSAAAALESAHLHSSARQLADMDALTQLPNRRRLEVDLDDEWERCRRYGRPLSMVMLDLDHFKRLNDEHGHLTGDQVLREVAGAISAALRSTDTAYRYGGEELVVLLRETGLDEAALCAERMREAVARLAVTVEGSGPGELSVTTSAGVGSRHARMAHHTELIAQADAALYEAKRGGRDRVVTASMSGRGALEEVRVSGEASIPARGR